MLPSPKKGGRKAQRSNNVTATSGGSAIQLSVHAALEELLRNALVTELVQDSEAKVIALKSLKLERLALAYTRPARRAVAYLEWISYLIAVQCLLQKRLDTQAENRDVLADQRKVLSGWFNLVFRIFKRLRRFQLNDKKLVLTIAEYLLRNGATNTFDKFMASVLLHHPRQLDLWLLVIDRQRQAGNFVAAIALAQKAYRFHPTATALQQTLRNLTTCVLLTQQVATRNGDEERPATATAGPFNTSNISWDVDLLGDD